MVVSSWSQAQNYSLMSKIYQTGLFCFLWSAWLLHHQCLDWSYSVVVFSVCHWRNFVSTITAMHIPVQSEFLLPSISSSSWDSLLSPSLASSTNYKNNIIDSMIRLFHLELAILWPNLVKLQRFSLNCIIINITFSSLESSFCFLLSHNAW